MSMEDSVDQTHLIDNTVKDLPESIRERAKIAAYTYDRLRRWTTRDMAELRKEVEDRGLEPTPEELGRLGFVSRTKHEPKDAVRFERREAYFIISCKDTRDVSLFHRPSKPNELWEIGGAYLHEFWIDIPNRIGLEPLLLIHTPHPNNPSLDSITNHERQHFINDALLDLHNRRFERGEESPKRRSEAATKDELLAYLRDGSSGSRISSALSTSYKQIFSNLDESTVQSLRTDIDEFVKAMNELKISPSAEVRQAYVYHLLNVPLSKMAATIRAVGKFYKDRYRAMEKYLLPAPLIRVTRRQRYTGPRSALEQKEAAEKELNELVTKYTGAIYTSDDDSYLGYMLEQMSETRENWYAAMHELKPAP